MIQAGKWEKRPSAPRPQERTSSSSTILVVTLAIDKIGGPFYSQEALSAYRGALKASLSPTIRLVELDAHINDERFALVAADPLMESLGASMEARATRSSR